MLARHIVLTLAVAPGLCPELPEAGVKAFAGRRIEGGKARPLAQRRPQVILVLQRWPKCWTIKGRSSVHWRSRGSLMVLTLKR
jgi:hypothetical protein